MPKTDRSALLDELIARILYDLENPATGVTRKVSYKLGMRRAITVLENSR